MARLLIVASLLTLAVMTFMSPGEEGTPIAPARAVSMVREKLAETTPRFRARLEAGADCAELMSLRDMFDPDSDEVAAMNRDLGSIGCDTPTSTRRR